MAALLRQHRNLVHTWLGDADLDPSQFAWSDYDPAPDAQSVLAHRSTGYSFNVNLLADGTVDVAFAPSRGGAVPDTNRFSSWAEAQSTLKQWALWATAENEPDLWADIGLGDDTFSESGSPDDNSPLSATEKQEIRVRIDAAYQVLVQAGIDEERLLEAHKKLDYLVAAADRMGRFDWRHFALGVMLQIGWDVTLTSPQAQAFVGALFSAAIRLLTGGH